MLLTLYDCEFVFTALEFPSKQSKIEMLVFYFERKIKLRKLLERYVQMNRLLWFFNLSR